METGFALSDNVDIRNFPNLWAENCFLTFPYMTKEEIDLWNADNVSIYFGEAYYIKYIILDIEEEYEPSFDIVIYQKRYAIKIKLPIFTNPQEEYRINVGCISEFNSYCLYKFKNRNNQTRYFPHYFGPIFDEYTNDNYIKYIDGLNIYINEKIKFNKLIPQQLITPKLETFPRLLENVNNDSDDEASTRYICIPYCYGNTDKLWNKKPLLSKLGKFVVYLNISSDHKEVNVGIQHRTTTRTDIPNWVETEIMIYLPIVKPKNIKRNLSYNKNYGYWEVHCSNIPIFINMPNILINHYNTILNIN